MDCGPKGVTQKEFGGSKDCFWNPRIWDGITINSWLRSLSKGGFRITPSRIGMFGIISGLSLLNSTLAVGQKILYGNKIRQLELKSPPVFIVGHWRSGTTLLHEYMIKDSRFTYCDTYDCYAPSHFLVSGSLFRPWVKYLLPKKRPMDNMEVGLDRPQEDEFALCVLGSPSPYLDIMFPNVPPIDEKFLTLRDITDQQRKKWLDILEYFLKALTVVEYKTVILKSPPHTARIKTILERFPDSKFIHLHRDPYTLFPSTCRLWMTMAQTHGLQHPKGIGLEEKVLGDFEKMYATFFEDISQLKSNQFIDISYDDLVREPVSILAKIYGQLELEDFQEAKGHFEEFAASQKAYKKNKFEISPDLAEKITQRWGNYIKQYGYQRNT